MNNNLNNLIKNIGKFLSGGAIGLTYQSWFEGNVGAQKLTDIQTQLIDFQTQMSDLKKAVNSPNEGLKPELTKQVDSISTSLQTIKEKWEDLVSTISNSTNTSNSISEAVESKLNESMQGKFNSFNEEILNSLNKVSEVQEFIDKNLKLIDGSQIFKLIEDFQNYLHTLSSVQLCILLDIFSIIFIFLCLTSIIFSFYGNFIIEKLSLESKFPKLAGFISIRKKFNHYYVLSNIIYIIINLIIMMHVNFVTFFSIL